MGTTLMSAGLFPPDVTAETELILFPKIIKYIYFLFVKSKHFTAYQLTYSVVPTSTHWDDCP